MAAISAFSAALLSGLTVAQQIGHAIPEVHPNLPTYRCTTSHGRLQRDTTVVLDAFFRNIHEINDTSVSCGTWSGLNTDLCPDAASCAKNCAIEGIDYAANGLHFDGDAITMNQFVKARMAAIPASVPGRISWMSADRTMSSLRCLTWRSATIWMCPSLCAE